MKKAYIDSQKCKRHRSCPPQNMCPVRAIIKDKKSLLFSSASSAMADKCIGCGKCIYHCPNNAITMK